LPVEDLPDLDKPVCIIDPKGRWWGINSIVPARIPAIPSSPSAASTLTSR
jgi:hypothetical protein